MAWMGRRRKEWEEEPEERPPQAEAAPAAQSEAAPEDEQDWREARSPQEALLRLQRAAGNQQAMRVMQRFSAPGLEEEEAVEAPQVEVPRLHELVNEEPAKQLAAFQEMEHLPAEAREMVEQAVEISRAPEAQLGFLAVQLKLAAKMLLGKVPSEKEADVLLDKLCSAVADAWAQWKLKAMLTKVSIMAVSAIDGEIDGPAFGPLVLSSARASSDAEVEAVVGLAGPISEAFKRWQQSVKIPGLPLYPSFAAFPAPVAPPTPNVPVPLASFKSDLGAFAGLAGAVRAGDPGAAAVARAVASAFGSVFPMWLAQTMVIGLLGQGPVPSFAPPSVPVGPVVGGTVLPVPGCFV